MSLESGALGVARGDSENADEVSTVGAGGTESQEDAGDVSTQQNQDTEKSTAEATSTDLGGQQVEPGTDTAAGTTDHIAPDGAPAANSDAGDQQQGNEEAEATTTVQFIAVSAEEHQRMIASGELPVSVQGADVHMQIPGAEAQQVRLIAVDSNGVPVTETAILQAAAEQAGIVFITKDDNNHDVQITIDEAMKLSEGGSGARHIITATTAAALLEQQNKTGKNGIDRGGRVGNDGNESEEENDGALGVVKPSLQLRVYSQKDAQSSDESFLTQDSTLAASTSTGLVLQGDYSDATATIMSSQSMELADDSVYEFQEPPTGKDSEEASGKIAIIDASMFKKSGGRRGPDKTRDRRKIYQCRECAFYSHRHSNLIRHIKIHTDERPYQCHLCERAFRTNTLLRNHINTHTGVKPYKCDQEDCEMAFVTSGELTRHIRYRHTHEKPFKCTLCDYASVEISKLRRHFRSHTGERPYACEDCGKAFADSFHLKRHRMSHTGEKPYECPECKQRFTQRGSVKMHIMQQHLKTAPKFACEICHTHLGRKSDLNVHMRKQHAYQEAPMQCRYCGELFHDRWSLMKHQRTHRSYGSRGPPTGQKEGRKRGYEDGENDDELNDDEDWTPSAKAPLKLRGHSDVSQLTVYVENDADSAEEEEGDEQEVVMATTDEGMGDEVTAVISESGEIVHLVESKMLSSAGKPDVEQAEDEHVQQEAEEDDSKLQIADGEDEFLNLQIQAAE